MTRETDDVIWSWYTKILDYQASGLTPKIFCEARGINYGNFCNKLYRLFFCPRGGRVEYDRLVVLVGKYKESGMSRIEFCKQNSCNESQIIQCQAHLNYAGTIERLKKERGGQPMKFISVQQEKPSPEVIEKDNDIQMTVGNGIKVSIPSHVSAEDTLKIINLLKDI